MKTELVTTLKRQATKILAELRRNRGAVLITEHGKPAAYLVNVDDYERMRGRMKILEGIARGELAVFENRVHEHEAARGKMKKWLE